MKVTLVEAKAHNGTSEVTYYWSTMPFCSAVGDTPSNTAYSDVILEIPSFRMMVDDPSSYGSLVLDNHDASLDGLLALSWSKRAIKVLYGEDTGARSSFTVLLTGTIDNISAADDTSITFSIRDNTALLDVPIAEDTAGEIATTKPFCIGEVYNISPILIDQATKKYQYHGYGAVHEDLYGGTGIGVYDKGEQVAYTGDSANGSITLTNTPNGEVTCRATGSTACGLGENSASNVVKAIINNYLNTRFTTRGTPTVTINTASFNQHNTDVPAFPYACGVYVDGRENALNIINKVLDSQYSYGYFNRTGEYCIKLFPQTLSNPVKSFTADDIFNDSCTLVERIPPIYRLEVRQISNFTVENASSLSVNVTQYTRMMRSRKYRAILQWDIANITSTHFGAESVIREAEYAAAGNSYWWYEQHTRNVERNVFEFVLTDAAFGLDLGNIVNITYPRYGFNAGVNCMVVGIEERYSDRECLLRVWK